MDNKYTDYNDYNNVIVDTKISEKDMIYKEKLLLTYKLNYPQFRSERYKDFLIKLNLFYTTKNSLFERIDIKRLYQLAFEDYNASLTNDYPFRPYEVYSDFTVTYNMDCIVSIYFDTYEYTGGAHGMTVREGETWNLLTGSKIVLSDLFVYPRIYQEYITSNVLSQISEDIKNGNDFYFDDYAQTVVEKFDKRNFYLTEEGIVVFYQLYDIAPYSSGIRTFLIPYKEGEVVLPSCYM